MPKFKTSATYRAFVSSTFQDLRDHRKHVIESLRKAGLDVEAMEEFSVHSKAPRDFCSQRMGRCNVCILLVGLRRGGLPPNEQLSFTQIEYEEARKLGIEVLPFLMSETPGESASWQPHFDEREKDPEIGRWRELLRKRHVVREFNADPLSIGIDSAIASWVVDVESNRAATFRRRVKTAGVLALAAFTLLLLGVWFISRTPTLRGYAISRLLACHEPLVFNNSASGRYEIARCLDNYASLVAETRLSEDVQGTQRSMDLLVNNAQYIRHAQRENFLGIVKRGGHVRILLWDYSDKHGNTASYDAFCRAIGQNPEETREGARNVHHEFLLMQKEIADNKAAFPGSFEFRWNSKPLFYTMWVRDWGESSCLGHLGLHFYRGQENFPSVRLAMNDSGKTLTNMHLEFEKAWEDAVDLDPPAAP